MSRADCSILGIMPLLVLCHLKKESFLFFGLWHELSVNVSHICMRLFAILADGNFISNLMSIGSLSVPLLSKYLPPIKLVLTPTPTPPLYNYPVLPPLKDPQTKPAIKYVKPKCAHLILCAPDACIGSTDSLWEQAVLGSATDKQEVYCNRWFPTGRKQRKDHARTDTNISQGEEQQGRNSASRRG